MVRQLDLNMIKETMPKQAPKQVKIYAAHAEDKQASNVFVCKSWLANQTPWKQGDWSVLEHAQATDSSFKRQLSTTLAYAADADTVRKDFDRVEEQGCCETHKTWQWVISPSWSSPRICLDLGAWKWMDQSSSWRRRRLWQVCHPANTFKHGALEIQTFFEPQLSDMAISQLINMGIKEIAAMDFDSTGKAAVGCYPTRPSLQKIDTEASVIDF